MNVFDCALKMEEEARVTYQVLASASASEEMKNLFTMLARAEQEHHDALLRVKKTNSHEQGEFKALDEACCLFQPLLAKRGIIAEMRANHDAYRLVVAQEEKGVVFYEELAGRAEEEGTRRILLQIAEEERRHLNIVENIYSFVESPKNFLAWGEFSNLNEY